MDGSGNLGRYPKRDLRRVVAQMVGATSDAKPSASRGEVTGDE